METETFRERLTSAAFGAGWNLVCRLPESVARALFNFGADVAWRRQGPGVQVVALVPAAGPVPPPSIEVTPDIRASSICWGQMK